MTTRILIDNSLDSGAPSYLFENATGTIRADDPGEVNGAIAALQNALDNGSWAAGFCSYELGYLLEPRLHPLLPRERDVPLLLFGLFAAPTKLRIGEADELLEQWSSGSYTISPPRFSMDRDAYRERFNRVKDYIAAGDIYQLNLTLQGRFCCEGSPVALYRDLRRKQPVAHGAFMQFDEVNILSHSPELFLHIADGEATTRPMKGTAGRGLTLDQDLALVDWLSKDEKSRAENLMIVDLMRNDLGRVSKTGSVRVSDLFHVETFKTLHQMTSDVTGQLKAATGLDALLRGLFPPGSITGAPKVRAMEIINELEDEPRGVYTGTIGMLEPGGNASFNVAIRTVMLDGQGNGSIGIGSGLVQDSQADAEYDECLLKMRFLTDPVLDFELIETLRFEAGSGYYLLRHHLDRLQTSARYFGFPCDLDAIHQALDAEVAGCEQGALRVRLLLSAEGSTTLTSVPMTIPEASEPIHHVFSDRVADSTNLFLYHKTTIRDLYDGEHARLSAKCGADEVLFVNERGELTEGSRTNIFIKRNGRLLTPPISSGLLAGTLRAELLAAGEAEEAVLRPEDISPSAEVYLGNSVRGLLPATPLASPARNAVRC